MKLDDLNNISLDYISFYTLAKIYKRNLKNKLSLLFQNGETTTNKLTNTF